MRGLFLFIFGVVFSLSQFLVAQTSCAALDAGDDITVGCSNPCADLTATFIGVPNTETSSYTIGEPACPLPPIDGGNPSNLTTDDVWSQVINIPFNFNFYQNDYNQLVICANGQLSFDTSLAGQPSGYEIGASELLPTTSRTFTLNTIYGAYHDMDPNENPDPSQINYFVSGTAPFRTFIVNFDEVEHFLCTSLKTTQQIILYESSNVIEVNLINKPICTSWNGGRATLGIQGNNLTEFAVPAGRNTGVWSATNEKYRFVPNGPQDPNTSIVWTDESGAVVGTGESVNVCPPVGVTTYTATLSFTLPDGSTESVSDDVTVTNSDTPVTPSFDPIPPICVGDPLGPFPTTSNNGVTGNWAPSPDNTTTTTYTFTPDSGQCATSVDITVVVNQNETPTFDPIPPICEGDPVAPLPITSLNGIDGSWSPPVDNTITTTYTFTPDVDECAIPVNLTIVVAPMITPSFDPVDPICENDPLGPLPTTSLEGVEGVWTPAIDNTTTTTYTFTPDADECATVTFMTIVVNTMDTVPVFDQVPPICEGDTLNPLPLISLNGIQGNWAPALDNTTTTTYTFTPDPGECATTAQMTITVDSLVTPTFNPIAPICEGDVLNPLPTTSLEGVAGVWSPDLDNTVTTVYIFTPNSDECATTATLTIQVNTAEVPLFDQVDPICEGDSLSPLPTTSLNGIVGSWLPALDNTVTTTYTFTPDTGECASVAEMTIIVQPLETPVFDEVAPICQGAFLDPLPTTSLNNIEGTWSPALTNEETTTYTFIPSSEECAEEVMLTIEVFEKPLATVPAEPFTICDNEGAVNDGRAYFDLEDLDNPSVVAFREEILTGQMEPNFELSFYQTRQSAENGDPKIIFPYLSRESPQTIFARVQNTATSCINIVEVVLEVDPLPLLSLQENYRICVDETDTIISEESGTPSPPILDTGLDMQQYLFMWEKDGTVLPDETAPFIIANEIGDYTVTVSDTETGCQIEFTATVTLSSPPFTWNIEVVTPEFSSNPIIEAEVTGLGNYQFQLDDGPPQSEGIFSNVQSGIHTVTISDSNGCGSITEEVVVVDFPKFITPNQDGYHDTWNINSLAESDPNAKIYIYDRYGKFISLITPLSNGWDGTFEGVVLPSNDYWFSAEFVQDGKTQVFKGHFSLKR